MRLGVFFCAVALLLCSYSYVLAQNTTNKGTEFWTAWMDHVNGVTGAAGSQMSLYITSDANTTGQVEVADGSFSQPFTVTANQVTTIDIPKTAFLGNNDGQLYKGIHITSQRSIAVYAHIYASSVSGATLLLPVNTLGKDYQSINYTQLSNSGVNNPSYSALMVIATEDNTTVEITPAAALISGHPAGTPFTVSLKKGEVYQGLSSTDLTGTRIRSISSANGACKRIAVFSGSSKLYIGSPNITSDNLFQQVYPTASWGKNYLTVPLASRSYDVFRIIASDPTAHITLNGNPVSYSAPYYEFPSQQPNVISSDKPVQVVQYAVTQGNGLGGTRYGEAIGDPEMIYLTPIEQGLDHVTLYSSPYYRILQSYINVVIPTAGVNTFKLDGVLYNQFTAISGQPGYSYAQIPVASGAHNISSTETFNAIAYGFGQAESYGYAAGTDLKNLTQNISLQLPTDNNVYRTGGCSTETYYLRLTLPYQTSSISWDFKDGNPAVAQTDYNFVTEQRNGQTVYIYTYQHELQHPPKGNHTIVATIHNPNNVTECGSDDIMEFDYNITDPNTPDYTVSASCAGLPTVFTDATDQSEATIKSWAWDFGDGQTSTDQNPTHTYTNAGNYTVALTVTNENGCVSSVTHQLHVSKLSKAAFIYAAPGCAGMDIQFTDKSVPGEGSIKTWEWDFGDGQTSTEQNPLHTYLAVQQYNVTLKVTDANGCSNTTPVQSINVHTAPLAQFDIPDVCLQDSYASFVNRSTIADGTDSEMTYAWDFGDSNASLIESRSTQKNPQHKFTATGTYNVTLTAYSKFGCPNTVTHQVTVNGSYPHAAFAVNNEEKLCSSNDVVFQDQSTESPGHITKMVWYFDYGNHPEESETYYYSKGQIPADGVYKHNYGYFTAPTLSKTYKVKLEVYSGESCFDTTRTKTITIYANPTVDIPAVGPVCEEATPFRIATDTKGFTGTETFSGKGVSATGVFDPKAAGVGKTTINYTFKTAVGDCLYATSFDIEVKPTPSVDAGPNQHMLEGLETVVLKATASGNNLTYKWTPATGLNRDDILQPTANPTDDTEYTLTVTSADGCVNKSSTNVHVLKIPEIPNTFTPNNDGVNDLWYIKHLELYPDCTVDIFSRDGEKIFSSVGYGVPWDGRLNGKELPVGVYYYIVNPKSGRSKVSGTITIIR